MANLITGLFDTEQAAENAVSQLKQLGYGENEISIIMRDRAAAADMSVAVPSCQPDRRLATDRSRPSQLLRRPTATRA